LPTLATLYPSEFLVLPLVTLALEPKDTKSISDYYYFLFAVVP
jgi:hypothetical protein